MTENTDKQTIKTDQIITINSLHKSFHTPAENLHVLRGLDFSLTRGEFVSIMGPSGSGKSTLLNILGLLDAFDSGTYQLAGIDTQELTRKQRQQIRLQKIGFIFQTFNLIQTLSVTQNIELPMALLNRSQEAQHEKSASLLEAFGLALKAKVYPYQLSIGEQQRVAIARALVNNPVLVLCDEPTGNLDDMNTERILEYLQQLRQFQTSIIIVSHNPAVQRITDHNYLLRNGILESM